MPSIVSTPRYPSNPPKWSNLKKITLKDMDSTKDKIYDRFILVAQIIDWSVVDSCIQTVVEDENCDVHRLTIPNWSLSNGKKHDMLKFMKVFHPNVKFLIANPYYRITNDGEKVKKDIFVQHPRYVKVDTSLIDKLCHVCGKEAKTLASCSDCKVA
uniref:Uncharacterized protein n=1 Tax=Panagrolaimus sp. PS1159 TaxID=55785 RepID=A0AC35FC43_9BILA